MCIRCCFGSLSHAVRQPRAFPAFLCGMPINAGLHGGVTNAVLLSLQ